LYCFRKKVEVRIENCVIKDYRACKVKTSKTSPSTFLTIDIEYKLMYDTNACLVWVPKLNNFKFYMYDVVTNKDRYLILKDIAGLPVGHVPRTLSMAFRMLIDMGATQNWSAPVKLPTLPGTFRKIKLMKGKAHRKHSLHEKTAASVLLKLFISSNE